MKGVFIWVRDVSNSNCDVVVITYNAYLCRLTWFFILIGDIDSSDCDVVIMTYNVYVRRLRWFLLGYMTLVIITWV